MEYKLYDHKFEWKGNFKKAANLVEQAFQELGYKEGLGYSGNGWMVYNHTCLDNMWDPIGTLEKQILIVKPTAPTANHFTIDDLGYANSSRLTFEEPYEYEAMYSYLNPNSHMDWGIIEDLIERKANKWDDSIILKWKPAKKIPKDHILIIGQMPEDETTNGFGFKGHFDRLVMIVERVKYLDISCVLKLHPKFKLRGKQKDIVDKWIQGGLDVRTGFESIHDFLPHARVAIIDNSTAGIECLMHEVPIISYGYPEYHWVTEKLKSLSQLRGLVSDTSWHQEEKARKFIYWYINDYLCYDLNSTKRRLKECIQKL